MDISVIFTGPTTYKDSLRTQKKLGEGKFSVFQVESCCNKKVYALKMFPNTEFGATQFEKEQSMSKLFHPNVIQYIPIKCYSRKFYSILTEFAPFGNFADLIVNNIINTEAIGRTYFHQLIRGLEYIHSQGIAHLDLKLDNLMMGSDYHLKIIDFDQSQSLTDKDIMSKGSVDYRAPEVANLNCVDSQAADIYSAGVILYALIMNEFPFLEREDPENKDPNCSSTFFNNNAKFWRTKIQQKGQNQLLSKDFIELVNGMLHPDPKKRWTIKQVKASNWYKGPILAIEDLENEIQKRLKSLEKK